MNKLRNTSKHIILSTILLQGILILLFTSSISTAISLETLKKSIPFINIAIIITTILIVISFRRIGEYEAKQIELKLMKTNIQAVEELITLLRSERHDYITHIQSIQALAYLEEYKELSKYLQGISEDYRITNQIIRVGHPALTALLNSKREVIQQKGITFNIECKYKLESTRLNSWELCSLVSNLIDNAIEATAIFDGERWIKLSIDLYDNNYVLEIENTGSIDSKIIDVLYELGVSTKDSPARGYGLPICKKILDKYDGRIEFMNTKKNTVKFIVKLPRGEFSYDKKIIS